MEELLLSCADVGKAQKCGNKSDKMHSQKQTFVLINMMSSICSCFKFEITVYQQLIKD